MSTNTTNKRAKTTSVPVAQPLQLRPKFAPQSSPHPKFSKGQEVIEGTRSKYLHVDNSVYGNNSLVYVPNVLPPFELETYRAAAAAVGDRVQGAAPFGHKTPRFEVAYTQDGTSYNYGKRKRSTANFPPHVLRILPLLRARFYEATGHDDYRCVYTASPTAVDIAYTSKLKRGGKISRHADDECDDWGLVFILSLGQTRWLRCRCNKTKAWVNVCLPDNSLVAMYGATFQQGWTHQVDELPNGAEVGERHSAECEVSETH